VAGQKTRGVLFDWRGTLVHDPPDEWWVSTACERIDRRMTGDAIATICEQLRTAQRLPEIAQAEPTIDCSPELHRAGSMNWFRTAGLDDELAAALYDVDFDPAGHLFYPDVPETFRALHDIGTRLAIVSDIHFDLRPEFVAAGLDQYVDAFVLSFEHGVQKPDPAIFHLALATLDVEPGDAVMVGDRASHDGGAVAVGITTLLLPALPSATTSRGLAAVLSLFS
jgi:HAD superfamily hydrolase (TIGR01509 family)